MPKGEYLSKHQKGIVNRYYSNIDAITVTKLQELSSEIYLASSDKVKDKLWKSVELWLGKTSLEASVRQRVVEKRDPKLLAEFVNKLSK